MVGERRESGASSASVASARNLGASMEGERRESGTSSASVASARASLLFVCVCACSAHARTGTSFIYLGSRWVYGILLIVIASRIY